MRVLIVAAVLAYASAAPSGLLAGPYGHGLIGHAASYSAVAHGAPLAIGHAAPLAVAHAAPLAVAHAAPLAVAAPTISPGDIQGAAIDAHVDASDHARAAVDAAREHHDQASELQGQAINAAEDHSWQAVDAVKTREAELDGAAAGAAPILAKQIAGHSAYAHAAPVIAHGAALAHGYAAAPIAHGYAAGPLAHGYAAGSIAHGYAAGPLAHGYAAAPLAHGYAAPVAHSQSVSSQSLHQTHPSPLIHAAPLAHGAPLAYGHGAHAW